MKILNANKIDQKKIETDVCIIGAGPVGIALALKLKKSDVDVVIAESGGLTKSERSNKLNALKIQSNFTYRDGDSERNRQLGGTANLWTGRVVPFSFDDTLDEEWDGLKEKVVPFYDEAYRLLGIDPRFPNNHSQSDRELNAYWADETERFNHKSKLLERNRRAQIYYNLSCIGEPSFENERIWQMGFLNKKGERIQIKANCFVFAMGAIENSRMLLIIRKELQADQKNQLGTVGKYIMDHPRIWHGKMNKISGKSAISRYQIKRTETGIYKTGIRNNPVTNRVYCNLMRNRNRFNKMIDYIPSESFEYSFRKLLMREKGILKGLANEMFKWPVIRGSRTVKKSIKTFFNDDSSESFDLMTYCEQRPREENQINLANERDQNGLPIPQLENKIHEEERREVLRFYEYLNGYLQKMDCHIDYDPEYLSKPAHYTDAAHPMGGTRYSSHQNKKVVGEDLSVVGIPNLYITGSSVFPTSSVENPTHLIISLSCYLAEVLTKKFR